MKLKNILLGAASAIAIFATVACQEVDPNDRLIYVKPAEAGRAVLIEDFTGQNCKNCPNGTTIINDIIKTYGEGNVIAVGIHSGPLSEDGEDGLATETGNDYYRNWDKDSKHGQPWAIFSRATKQPVGNVNTWAQYVNKLITKKAPITLSINNTYDATSRQLTTAVEAISIEGTTTGKLQVWLIEDGIVAFQIMDDGTTNDNYVHNHVFRAAVNGTWGEDVTVDEGAIAKKQYTYTLPEKWNAEKVSVVAFVYNDKGVQQVTKKAVLAENTAE